MRNIFLLFFVLVLNSGPASGQNYYWLAFTDKNDTSYSLSNPSEFLSSRAIERRIRQNIPIDSLDLPVNQSYIDSVLKRNVELVHASKWLNGITLKAESSDALDGVGEWSFVDFIQLTKPGSGTKSANQKFKKESELAPIDTAVYGDAVHQVGMLNGQFLHNEGILGQGMHIAVLDGGFKNANTVPAFDSLWANKQILGIKDFVEPNSNFYETHYHGMSVLSCMGGNVPGQLIGTAPKASYWMLRSEDTGSEYIVEEDHWVAAAEFADSVGVDIINSSLGYYEFDDPTTNHTYADMDGKTTRVTQAANIAASRGILVFASAGNERDDDWFRIIAPSDGVDILGVGAVDKDLQPAYFTSAGPAFDGAIKPNVSAMGYRTVVQRSNGSIGLANGTSFSSPVMAGMAACLWQKYPTKTAQEIKKALEESGHLVLAPDSLLGYGVPNMEIAEELLNPIHVHKPQNGLEWSVFPNPVKDRITIQYSGLSQELEARIEMFSLNGQVLKVWQEKIKSQIELNDLPAHANGVILLQIKTKNSVETFKLIKN